jgi:hypothetical protein
VTVDFGGQTIQIRTMVRPRKTSLSDGLTFLMTDIDTSVPHSARLRNHWLGGSDNFPVDREVADSILAMVPEMVTSARADREFPGHDEDRLLPGRQPPPGPTSSTTRAARPSADPLIRS